MKIMILAGLLVIGQVSTGLAQGSFTIEPLKEAPPDGVAAEVKASLETSGFRVLNPDGKPFADLWLRKGVPASAKPAGPKGTVLFPFLEVGTLVGVLRFPGEEGSDYKEQPIPQGVYTMRYGLQPVNGDHLGVSTHRDYVMLVPAEKDASLAAIAQDPLEEKSAESAGASHPAVFLLLAAPESAKSAAMVQDEAKGIWGAVVPVSLAVAGEAEPVAFPLQIVVFGAGPH